MYFEFAYSRQMQLVLILVTFTITFFSMFILSNVILSIFGLSASRRQKSLFAFINGTLVLNIFVFVVYFFYDMKSFSPLVYHLVVSPNPLSAIIYYITAKDIFKLSSVRTIKLMSYVILFISAALILNRIIGSLFFIQNEAKYNYLKDTLHQIVHFGVILMVYVFLNYYFKRKRSGLKFADNMFINKNREFVLYIMKISFAYVISVSLPLLISEHAIAYMLNLLLILFFIAINICLDIIAYNKQSISNRDMHISGLFKSIEELRGIKHDFNNILQNYSGYIELKEYGMLEEYHASLVSASSYAGIVTDLTQKMPENPALITLLINKLEYAEKMNVRLFISLTSELDNLYIDNMDVSQILLELLDNAIEWASHSQERKVYFTIESKAEKSKLIIITNSIPVGNSLISKNDDITRSGPNGIISLRIQKIIAEYGNCSFQIRSINNEFSVYIELKELV